MINYAILGEHLENGEEALGLHFRSSYLFLTPQNDLKKITHKKWWYVPIKKIKVFGDLLSILILAFHF